MTLAAFGEGLYQLDTFRGTLDKVVLRYHKGGQLFTYTRQEMNTRIKVVAARLQQVAEPGDRIAILASNSPEYLQGFIGALYANMVPVPLYDPTEPGHGGHLTAVFGDSHPAIVLTNTDAAAAVRKHFSALPGSERPRIIVVDKLDDSLAEQWSESAPRPGEEGTAPVDQTAFLQYTSGSTSTPKGVVLSTSSIMTNVMQIFQALDLKLPLRLVSWVPLHHDLGIIIGAFVQIFGFETDLMSPRDFLQQPARWVRQLNKRAEVDGEEDNVSVFGAVPNFALDIAGRYGLPKALEDGDKLDFSMVEGLIVGSEPVTRSALENFIERFEPYGFKPEAVRPSYGLAEASLLVSTPLHGEAPVVSHFDRERLAEGIAERVEPGENAVAYISNGQVAPPQELVVVDPETHVELPEGTVGELWANGANMALGYLGRPEQTDETFHNTLKGRLPEGSRVINAPDDNWMATGDLGVVLDDEIYVTGRLKDLVVIAGRNHYPQDIEATTREATEHINSDGIAAFSVPGEDVEKLVIIAERDEDATEAGDAEAVEKIRMAVNKVHGISPDDVVIVGPMEIPRTSSAKIARSRARQAYESNA